MPVLNTNDLPIHSVLPDIKTTLQQHHTLVLQAAPGAGKTTMVPLALLDEPWLQRQKIVMLEPRRMAARTAAERMASLLGEKVGETVGYRIRQQTRVSESTRIEVITEGVLTRMLQQDPELSGVGLVIFDEFHERNLNSDLGLALTLQARELLRESDPLKLLVMSATLEGMALSKLLDGAPQITSEGRSYPVEIHYCGVAPVREPLERAMLAAVQRALAETDGSILVFLPGQREIQRLSQLLKPRLEDDTCLLPLYGALRLNEQMKAIRALSPQDEYRRKVVLATDIAETSITIDGVSTVVDSGLSRQPGFDPATGMTRLHTRRISRASSIQRMGRAGRTRPGHCYRLWNESMQASLPAQTPPEIQQADLAPLALQLLQWGVDNPAQLQWLDAPPPAAFQQALDLLDSLGAIRHDDNHAVLRLSPHGEQMAQIPTHPRLAHMLITAAAHSQLEKASVLSVLLSEKDPLQHYSADIGAKVDVLLGDIPCEARFKNWLHGSRQQMQMLKKTCAKITPSPSITLAEDDVIGWLISLAYPDRLAQRRSDDRQSYLLSNGRAAVLPKENRLAAQPYLAIAELGGLAGTREDRIYAAAPLNPALFDTLLSPLLQQQEIVEWVGQEDKMVAERQTRLGGIVLQRQRLTDITPENRQQAIAEWIRKKGLNVLEWDQATISLRQRIACLVEHKVESGADTDWPDVSDAGLLTSIEQWLLPFLDAVRNRQDLKKINLHTCLLTLLPWPLPQKLEQLAPERIEVASGSRIKIDYSQSPPVLAVKLQEMFGCHQTPAIANGKLPLLVHLLSPGRKPLQITQDLAGFWCGSYHAVKKEMKGRYPKHPWPDDPLQALPTRFTKNHKPRS